jgi:hypothetical protein
MFRRGSLLASMRPAGAARARSVRSRRPRATGSALVRSLLAYSSHDFAQ